MELVVRKTDLLRELQLFQGIVERKNTIPILANVLMETEGDEVKFLATDLEVGLRSKCKATVCCYVGVLGMRSRVIGSLSHSSINFKSETL